MFSSKAAANDCEDARSRRAVPHSATREGAGPNEAESHDGESEAGEASRLGIRLLWRVELRGFEPLTSSMPSESADPDSYAASLRNSPPAVVMSRGRTIRLAPS